MSFSWIFALIVGGIILFGAIYAVSQFSKTSEVIQSATSASELENIFDELESTQESAAVRDIIFPIETRISNKCDTTDIFGRQSVSVEELIKKKWTSSNIRIYSKNKYVFSDELVEGKTFSVFTKPFYFPYKVANLIYLTSNDEKYCFKNPPREIRSELKNLIGQEQGLNAVIDDCTSETINICFSGSSSCDINVDYTQGYLIKDGKTLYFEGDALLYAAIFGDSDLYECGLKRLMRRADTLAELYTDKSLFILNTCDASVMGQLISFQTELEQYSTSSDLGNLAYEMNTIDSMNKYSECKLW